LLQLLKFAEVELTPGLLEVVDPELQVETQAKAISAIELSELYKEKVPITTMADYAGSLAR
jgi:hypothetical protein